MDLFFNRYSKTTFFLGLLTLISLLTAWDYPRYFSKWLYLGLPLTLLIVYGLYATVYFCLYPSFKVGKSIWKKVGCWVLISVLFPCLFYWAGKISVSQEEFERMYNSIKIPTKKTGSQAVFDELFVGSIISYLMYLGICWFFVVLHRKKNLGTRLKKWWSKQSLSDSGLLLLYLLLGWGCWLFFTLSPVLISGKDISWPTTILMLLPSMLFFYINLKTNFNLMANNQILLAVLVTLCWWAVLLIVKASWFIIITQGFGFSPILDGKNVYATVQGEPQNLNSFNMLGRAVGYILKSSAFQELIILLASFIYGYNRRVTQYRKEMVAIAETRQQEQLKQKVMEKEVVDARLQSLKYQINPHFLFNSLNFLYSQSLPLSEDLARATMLLSKMMRYGLQENNEEAKVSLSGEVEHLENFIEFNQLRFSNQLQIDFQVKGPVAIRRIMPLLLITFVENAFKYGELHDVEHPLQIHLTVDSEKLYFLVKNKKRKGPKEDSTGIGLDNIRKRLTLGYPDRHSLDIYDDPDFYATELVVIL